MNGSMARRRVRRIALAAAIALGASAVVASAPETAGAAVAGPGIGSKEALAAPGCDPTTERLAVQWYAAPSCVRPFEVGDDNGGSTADGVTKDAIKVTVLLPPEEKDRAGSGAGIRNQATGEQGLSKDALLDHNAIFSQFWQTWGRTVTFEYVEASGTDEAAQRADALTVIDTKPFAAIDTAAYANGGGGPVFKQLVDDAGIVMIDPPVTSTAEATPYLFHMAEFAGKNLVGKKTQYAGADLNGKPRVFGVVYSSNSDISEFNKEFAKYGGKAAVEIEHETTTTSSDNSARDAMYQEQAPSIVSRLKDAGVTTVITFADGAMTGMVGALTKQATAQEWFPEWAESGLTYTDLDYYARQYDQQQWAHTFGPVWFVPHVEGGTKDAILDFFQWYWGTDQGTHGIGIAPFVLRLYNGIHLAGPNLTPATHAKALTKFGLVGGAFNEERTTLETGYTREGEVELPRHGHRVVEPRHRRAGEPDPSHRQGQVHVPVRCQAVRDRHDPQEHQGPLRRDEVDRVPRRHPVRGRRWPVPVRQLPELRRHATGVSDLNARGRGAAIDHFCGPE